MNRLLLAYSHCVNIKLARLKTGTPARLLKNTINYENLEEQLGDKNPEPFSTCLLI